ncbi:DUF3515 family protein [Kytococcus sp. Marseille-QA3725]
MPASRRSPCARTVRRPAHRRLRATVVLLVAGSALAGCSRGEVDVTPAPLADEAACREAAGKFPESVAGAVEQPVPEDAADSAAAWGNPAIVARCGAADPGPTTDRCLTVRGVDWVVQDLDDGIALVTYGRTPALEVLVPSRYPQSADLVASFADAAKSLEDNGRSCT